MTPHLSRLTTRFQSPGPARLLAGLALCVSLLAGSALQALLFLRPAEADLKPPSAPAETVAEAHHAGSGLGLGLGLDDSATTRKANLPGYDAKGDFMSYVLPSDALLYEVAAAEAGDSEIEGHVQRLRHEWSMGAYHGPDPLRLERIRNREQAVANAVSRGESPDLALRTLDQGMGQTDPSLFADGQPVAAPMRADGPDLEGTLRLFIVAVEFAGEDTVENFSHPVSMTDRECVTDTVRTYSGPLHGTIQQPSPNDNETFWLESFERDFYEQLIFSKEGISDRPRIDLRDPVDGQPGIDFSGLTMTNFYEEVSKGKVSFDGGPKGAIAWVQVPHSVAYYAATRCTEGNAPRIQSMNGLPTNPRFPGGVSTLAADVVDAINESDPNFPWHEYDTDGDNEIDHVVLIHAGLDKSDGGGNYTTEQIWAHRGSVDGRQGGYLADDNGTPDDPSDDVRLRGYTIQPENLYLGVLTHEFGHDLGLPDLYDGSGASRNSVSWWAQMSLGARTGRLNGSDPTHMSPWSKMVLDWDTPKVITPTDEAVTYDLGQASNPPPGTDSSLMIEIPPTVVRDVELLDDSTQVWHSGADQSWANARLTRDLDLSAVDAGTPISFTFDLNYEIERNWDYAFFEVSTDAGQTFTQTKGIRLDTGDELTTPDDYNDPNGMLEQYGNLRYGYTGNRRSWTRVGHDLSQYAGQAVQVRFRYVTDGGTLGYGAFVDNIKVHAGDTTLLDDPVENDAAMGWRIDSTTLFGSPGNGWRFSIGTREYPRYYMLEWRNPTGFDKGLAHVYNTVYSRQTEDGRRELFVDHFPTNAPGLVVWVWDTRFGSNNQVLAGSRFNAMPSEGAKGGLLVLDAHPEPLRGPRDGSVKNAFGKYPYPPLDNWDGRTQTSDAAFNLSDTASYTLTASSGGEDPATTVMTPSLTVSRPGVPAFHDALGYYPGVEELPEPITVISDSENLRIKRYAFTDPDASVVVPAGGYYSPRTPEGFTGMGAEQSPPSADVSTEETMFVDRNDNITTLSLGAINGEEVMGEQSGNPGDSGVHLGFHFEVIDMAEDGTVGTVRIWRSPWAADLAGLMEESTDGAQAVVVRMEATNVGGAGDLLLYSDFDETTADLLESGLGAGAVPVGVSAEELLEALRLDGVEALGGLAVDTAEAVAVAWAGRLGSGRSRATTYQLVPNQSGDLSARHHAFALGGGDGPLDTLELLLRRGATIFLPSLFNEG